MRGTVTQIASESEPGTIIGPNQVTYAYTPADLRTHAPRLGQDVLFRATEGRAREIYAMSRPRWCLRKWLVFYLSPRGRISRKAFWLYGVLAILAVQAVVNAFLALDLPFAGAMLVSINGIALVLAWSMTALTIKRLHDLGYSGLWAGLPYALVLVGAVVGLAGLAWPDGAPHRQALFRGGFMVAFPAVPLALWAYVWAPLGDGQVGYNRFGPDPRQEATSGSDEQLR
jgi:uncharacterized membrane protein YhaH (DUF805 family)